MKNNNIQGSINKELSNYLFCCVQSGFDDFLYCDRKIRKFNINIRLYEVLELNFDIFNYLWTAVDAANPIKL